MTLFDLFRADRQRLVLKRTWLYDRTDENYKAWQKAEREYTELLRQSERSA